VIDDMGGLYSHASEAFRAGERAGRYDYWRSLVSVLSFVSLKYEKQNGDLATQGFHVAEECIRAAGELRERCDNEKTII